MDKDLVYDNPKKVAAEVFGDFVLELNDWGEIRISNKYDPTTFVIADNQTAEFVQKLNKLQERKEHKRNLIQLHHQFKDGHTEMKAQRDIQSNEEMSAFSDEIMPKYPLPDGAQWLACDEKSKHFVWAAGEDSGSSEGKGILLQPIKSQSPQESKGVVK